MPTLRSASRRALISVGSSCAWGAFALAACGPSKPAAGPRVVASAKASASTSASAKASAAPPMPKPLPASVVGTFGQGTFGPTVARGPKGALVVSAPSSPTGRRWLAQAIDEAGKPIVDAKHELAEAPEDTSVWQVTAVGDGFVLAWTRATDAGAQLLSLSLAADGSARGAPTVIARGGDEIVDVRITPVQGAEAGVSAVLTFGERSVPRGAATPQGSLFAIALDAGGRPTAQAATPIAERLAAWSVAAIDKGQLVAAYVQHPQGNAGAPVLDVAKRSAKVSVLAVGAKGVTASDPLLVAEATVLPEIDVARLADPGKAVVAWIDRRDIDEHVYSVVVDATGAKPRLDGKARRTTPPRGDQSIVGLAPTPTGPVMLWEDVSPRPIHDARRRFSIARLSATGEATSRPRSFWFPYDDNLPELAVLADRDATGALAGHGDDVAVLTYGAACLFDGKPGSKDAACEPQDLRPFVVRFSGPTLLPAQTDMIDLGDAAGGVVQHAFDLSCRAAGCEALAEGPTDPATIALVKLATRTAPPPGPRWAYTETIDAQVGAPRFEAATALARESQFAGMRATRAANGRAFVAWVTYAPDDLQEEFVTVTGKGKGRIEKGKTKVAPGAAKVAVRALDAAGEPLGPVSIVSERALSKGNVAVAASALDKGGGVVAYVSRGEGDEEVYASRIDDAGKKVGGNARITHAPGGASDVALAPLPDGGYLLAWVDQRKSAPGVYAVRLDRNGGKQGAEVHVGGTAADLADVSVATIGQGPEGAKVAIGWSDARDHASAGFADVWFTIVGARDVRPLVQERALVKTQLHSHAPVVTARGDGGAVFAWIEDDPNATEMISLAGKDDWGAFVARVDGMGNLLQPMTPIALDPSLGKGGVVTGVALDCPAQAASSAASSACRLALSFGDKDGVAMLATTLTPTTPPARTLWSFRGFGNQEVAPSVTNNAIYLCEDGPEIDDGRVRRLSVAF